MSQQECPRFGYSRLIEQPPEDVLALILGTCEYADVHSKEDFSFDQTEVPEMGRLSWLMDGPKVTTKISIRGGGKELSWISTYAAVSFAGFSLYLFCFNNYNCKYSDFLRSELFC